MASKLGIVINYCSNDRIFIDGLLRECQKIGASQTVVSVGDHFYNMEKEDIDHICDVAARHPWVDFVLYEVSEKVQNPLQHRKGAFWHNVARIHGVNKLRPDVEWVLFLDADEIPEGERFKEWYVNTMGRDVATYKLANYWYFREPILQATTWEDSVMLVPRYMCTYQSLMTDIERDGIPIVAQSKLYRDVVHTTTKLPMFHHYSWVRPKDALIRKTMLWGHKNDEDWVGKINAAYEREFNVETDVDFIHGYKYVRVPNWFGIDLKTN